MPTPLADLAQDVQIVLSGRTLKARVLTAEHLCEFDSWVRAKRCADAAQAGLRAGPASRDIVAEGLRRALADTLTVYRLLDEGLSFPGANWLVVKALSLAGTVPADLDALLARAHPDRELFAAVRAVVPMWARLDEKADPTPGEEPTSTSPS